MKKLTILFISLIMSVCSTNAKKPKTVTLKFIETTDVHGMFFPTNYTTGKPVGGSMARVSSYVKSQRASYGDNVILLDNGDILQGQPTNYYWNYIDTQDENIAASVVNYMGYDAQAYGNHDIETGHDCYDKWNREVRCPVLAANMINTETGQPYTQPYKIIVREGIKIAILGMTTPAVPNWLSENLWSGIRFEEMVSCTRKWVKTIKEKENPDLIVGLFHSGLKGGIENDEYDENATLAVALRIHGLDIIFYGHDHQSNYGFVRQYEEKTDEYPFYFITKDGGPSSAVSLSKTDSVLIVNPGSNAHSVGEATVTLTLDNDKVASKKINGQIVSMKSMPIDEDYMKFFSDDIRRLQEYATKKVGTFESTINMSDAFFGSSAFIDFILNLQMKSSDDHFLLFDDKPNERSNGLKNFYGNFDSAAGIDYTVDVTKPEGQKVSIIKMSNGQPFGADNWYRVAINSYRGSGGGELLTKGAGIPKEELKSRILSQTELDQRHYLTEEIKKQGSVNPKPNNNWRFIPEDLVAPAIQRDRELLFGKQ